MTVAAWVKSMTEEVLGAAPFKIGDVVKHPSGRTVKIIGGAYWGEHGLSNHWFWKEVLPSGKLGEEEYGYGWENK
jgi:hypothetical protein